MNISIRLYKPDDLPSMFDICLKTGDNGKDASHLYEDSTFLGQRYVEPYTIFEPELCYVVTVDEVVSGYIVGAKDSESFYERCEREWFPKLRARYPLPNPNDNSSKARLLRLLHNGIKVEEELKANPAHLHINLLPVVQGKGVGKKLMEAFLSILREMNVSGVHLKVGEENPGAIKFYDRVGFKVLKSYPSYSTYGIEL